MTKQTETNLKHCERIMRAVDELSEAILAAANDDVYVDLEAWSLVDDDIEPVELQVLSGKFTVKISGNKG